MSARDEIVPIVDRDDNIVDEVPRHVMRSRSLRHRVTYIFVFDTSGRLFVQKRTPTKDLYPGYYDLAAGGVVCVGESYEDSAAREAREELGIIDVPLQSRFKFYFADFSAMNELLAFLTENCCDGDDSGCTVPSTCKEPSK